MCRSGTSATSRSRPQSESSFPTRSSRSITCSTALPGSSRASLFIRSGCGGTSSRVTGSSSAIGSCWLSSMRASLATMRTGWSNVTRCVPGKKRQILPSSFRAIPRSPVASTLLSSSTWIEPSDTSTPSSTVCTPSPRRRYQSMPEAALHVGSGKVRELYALDEERLLLVASDRISTFDVVLPTDIPDKGRVLTGLSAFWFAQTSGIGPNHLLGLRPDGRSTECRRLEMLPLECVVRGYLAGSGWKDYQRTGSTSGRALPAGLRESDRLPEPIFTPSTKATTGHDENIDAGQAIELVGR